ncbi:MAG: DUF1501 domain-containing protein [Gemmataceae bacterium]|nr:DUF1501 domain-containing protein [Gemmataceae bacterium]
MKNHERCPGPQTRRQFMKIGAGGLGGAFLGGLGQIRADQKKAGISFPDTQVIFIWLPGGPPHMETYDMKPDAPVEYRGEFRPIRSTVPGIDVCELLPLHAKTAKRFSLIRSVAHGFADHGGGHKKFLTGRNPMSPVGFVNDHPMVGSMVAKMRENLVAGIPNYIAGMDNGRQGIDTFSFGSAYLDQGTHPFTIPGDPSSVDFKIQNLRIAQDRFPILKERLNLLASLDDPVAGKENARLRERAMELLTREEPRVAFDLRREPEAVRERYGMHAYGQRCLMARRMVEAGASFVTMVLESPNVPGKQWPKGVLYNWDSHAVNGHIFDDARWRFPMYDQAITALIDDLHERGLAKKVLLIVTGEFGRTPKISYANGTQTGVRQPGRDHWPQAMSILVSGGGLNEGIVVGSTNSKGEHPKNRPLTPNDLWATMFSHLGIDYNNTSFLDHSGRPMPILASGDPIGELL